MRALETGPLRWIAIIAGLAGLAGLAAAVVVTLWMPSLRIEKFIDLLDPFELATRRAPRISVAEVTIDGSRRRAIVTDRRVVALRGVPVFPGAVLRFSIAVDERAWDQAGDGVTFKVHVRRGKLLFTGYLDPKSRPSDRRWVPVEVPIAEQLRDELEMPSTVDLVLSIAPGFRGDERHDPALWADLRVEKSRWDWPGEWTRSRTWPWSRSARRPNVVVISIDTLRADSVGATVAGRAVTPHIDRMGARSIRFERAYAPANHTLLSHASLFTGLYPETHGVKRGFGGSGMTGITSLPDTRVTLAESLQAHGYVTAGFAFDCVWLDERFGFAQGFDRYSVLSRGAAARNETEILPWLDANYRNPFFLFVHYYDVHSDWTKLPYDAPEELLPHYQESYDGDFDGCGGGACATKYLRKLDADSIEVSDRDLEYIRRLYDAGVEATDRQVGRLVERLESLGVLDDTLIVITSDHGEEFREHGRFIHTQLYEEIARVPLLFHLPGDATRAAVIDEAVVLLDVMPTILDLVGIPLEDAVEGRSLRPLMQRQGLDRAPVFLTGSGMQGVVDWPWKLIRTGMRYELYNLERDPLEKTDLGSGAVAERDRLRAVLDKWRAATEDDAKEARPALVETDEADVERLHALGYVD